MGLRRKLLLIIGLILAVLLVLLYFVSSAILLNSFSSLENRIVRQEVNRVRNILDTELVDLNRSLHDWAARDETYAFVETGYGGYIVDNLDDKTFIDLRLNLMVFVRYPNEIVYGKGFDPQSGRPATIPQSLYEHLTPDGPLLALPDTDSYVAGLLLLPEGPLLVAAQPVLTSRYQGPIKGVLIFGRFLGAAEIARLSQLTYLTMDARPYDDPQLPSDFMQVRSVLTSAQPTIVQSPGVNSIAGYTLLSDIQGRPALIVRIVTPRDVYYAGQAALNYIFLSLLAIGLVFGEATIILMDRMVISRTTRLSKSVTQIRTSGNLADRMDESGRDEITHLAREINLMLTALQRSQQELHQTQQELEQRVAQRTAELSQIAGQLEVVNRIARAASGTLLLDELLETVYQETQPLFQCDAFFIALYDHESAGLDFRLLVDADARAAPQRLEFGKGLSSRVVAEAVPLLIADYEKERERLPPASLLGDGPVPRTWLGVPMQIGERVVGVISVQAYRPHAYGEPEQRLLSLIADQVAVAVDNARLYTATQSRADELALLNEIGVSLTSQLEFSTIVRAALARIQRLFQATEVALLQTDSWSGELRFVQTFSGTDFYESPLHAESGEGFAGWVLQHRRPVLAPNARSDRRFSPAVDQHGPQSPQGLMAVPLSTPEQTIGVLEVTSGNADIFTADHLRTLRGIASTMTIALVNARLYNEIKNLLLEREQAQAQLVHAEKMSALGRLAASISHEINNPLQAIQFCLSLVEEDIARRPHDAETAESVATIHTEVERISAIVRRMRDFYRPAHEGRQLTVLHAVIDAVLDLGSKQLEHNHIAVVRDYAPAMPPLRSNPDYLKQVFLNLVLNAIDAMPDGGTLTVRTSLDETPMGEEYIGLRAVRIAFCDTGIGMSPEIQSHLFEPFFTTKEGGSGLGLSISYGIIQSLGGLIEVTSAEEEGTTFAIVLPTDQP
jgi:signal transduction histidine kinase/sensor domain CHASE-containing protein